MDLIGRDMFNPADKLYEAADPDRIVTVSGELVSPDFQIKGYIDHDHIARAYGTTEPVPFAFATNIHVEVEVKDQGYGPKTGELYLDRIADDGFTVQRRETLALAPAVGSEPRDQFKRIRRSFLFPLSDGPDIQVGKRFRIVAVCPKSTGERYIAVKGVKIIFKNVRDSDPRVPSPTPTPSPTPSPSPDPGPSPAPIGDGESPVTDTGTDVGGGGIGSDSSDSKLVRILLPIFISIFVLLLLYLFWRRKQRLM